MAGLAAALRRGVVSAWGRGETTENLNPEKLMAAYWNFGELALPAISGHWEFFSKPAVQPGPFSRPAIQTQPLIGATNFAHLNFGCTASPARHAEPTAAAVLLRPSADDIYSILSRSPDQDGPPRWQPPLNAPRPHPSATSAAVPSGRCGIASSRPTSKPGWSSPAARTVKHRRPMSSEPSAAISNAASSPTASPAPTATSASTIF